MGAGGKNDAGLFGWREWEIPKEKYVMKHLRTPHPKFDGSFVLKQHANDEFFRNLSFFDDLYNPARFPNLSPKHTALYKMDLMPHRTFGSGRELSGMLTGGTTGKCENFEIQAYECMEYYGMNQGMEACKDWYDDLMECRHNTKRNLRLQFMSHMRLVVQRGEYFQGKRDKWYEPPPKYFAFLEPTNDPTHPNFYCGGTAT